MILYLNQALPVFLTVSGRRVARRTPSPHQAPIIDQSIPYLLDKATGYYLIELLFWCRSPFSYIYGRRTPGSKRIQSDSVGEQAFEDGGSRSRS